VSPVDRYRLDGYALGARLSSGRVERVPEPPFAVLGAPRAGRALVLSVFLVRDEE
jgi:hypothetical protein